MKNLFILASPWVRLISVVADLSFSYLIYSYLLSLELFSVIYQKLFLLLVTSFERGVEVFTGLILFYFVYFFIRFYSSLLFSQTLGQALFGIESEGQGLAKRWKASLRTMIEFCTTPLFFITDVMILFGKRTLKEKLSASSLLYCPKVLRLSAGIGATLFLLALLYYAPLLTHQKYLSANQVPEEKISSESISSKTNFSSFRLIPSNYFSFASFSSLLNEQIVIIPQYEKMRRESVHSFKPKILFYDRKSSEILSFKRGMSFSWIEQVKEIRKSHPLFSFYYPALSEMIRNSNDFKRISYEGETRKKLFSVEIESEIHRLVKSSFELNFSNSHRHILNHGPFLKSNFVIKDFFLSKLDATYPVEISILEIGNYFFLSLVQKIEHENERIQHLLSLSSEQADHFILISGIEEKAEVFRKQFMQTFFGEIEFFSDYQTVFKLQDFLKDRKDLMIYDVLLNEKIALEERPVLARELKVHLQEKLKSCENDQVLLSLCQQMMTDAKLALNYFNEKYPDHWGGNILSEEKKVTPKKTPKKANKRRK